MVKTAAQKGNGRRTATGPVSNDAEFHIAGNVPYVVSLEIEGTAAILFHRWSCEDVAEKAKSAKGSKGKKTDNVESYVYRNDDGDICIPGEYLRQSVIWAAKFRQDPRSPRKSAMDLFKAGVVSLTELASLGTGEWDYLDQRRVTVQRAGITRIRPAFTAGWRAAFDLQVLVPEYLPPADLLDTVTQAGRLVGVADFRPTYGRFQVVRFEVIT
jgi:hypothetical protein